MLWSEPSKSYGQIAYEAYCNHTDWKSLATGQSLPQWEGLKPEIREAWEVSSGALRDHLRQEWNDAHDPIED